MRQTDGVAFDRLPRLIVLESVVFVVCFEAMVVRWSMMKSTKNRLWESGFHRTRLHTSMTGES